MNWTELNWPVNKSLQCTEKSSTMKKIWSKIIFLMKMSYLEGQHPAPLGTRVQENEATAAIHERVKSVSQASLSATLSWSVYSSFSRSFAPPMQKSWFVCVYAPCNILPRINIASRNTTPIVLGGNNSINPCHCIPEIVLPQGPVGEVTEHDPRAEIFHVYHRFCTTQ